jgi:hypothetical protein
MARLEEAHSKVVQLQNDLDENKISFETYNRRLDVLKQIVDLY